MSCFRFPKEKSGDEHSVLLGWVAHKRSVPCGYNRDSSRHHGGCCALGDLPVAQFSSKHRATARAAHFASQNALKSSAEGNT